MLYSLPLDGAAKGGALCLGSLGGRTTAFLADLPSGGGLVVVARNAGGEGSYGIASDGTLRARATNVCP